jgi:broad specificity phosphatase PhoE
MKLLLIRHGQSVANTEGRLQGQFDSPLTDLGRDQAQALARRLVREGWTISTVYASDLSRAAETAGILAAELCAPLALDERLREYDVGVLTGIVWREIEHLFPDIWHALHHDTAWGCIPGEEGNGPFHARLAAVLSDIQSGHGEEESVALVSHGGSLGMILVHLLGMEPRGPSPFRFGNVSLSVVEFSARGPLLLSLNDMCHLDGDLR